MSLFEKRKVKEPEEVFILEAQLKCGICSRTKFWKRESQLHTKLLTFFELEWMNKTATCYVCAHCGHVHWFLPPEE
ncbi:MAG TPA: hypothetical protein VE398_10540 [Acidobacteriota bacterium]|nr:hypothetical protein [Acidobacteriota bacterium]